MKTLLFVTAAAAVFNCQAQQRIDPRLEGQHLLAGSLFYSGINGEPFTTQKYSRLVDGTPYFKDEWRKAVVVLPNGNAYQNVEVRVNLLDGTLHYRTLQGEEQVAKAPVSEVVFQDAQAAPAYYFIAASALPFSAPKPGWYQRLHDGRVALYKHFGKELWEQKPYGSASEEQRILTRPSYFIVQNGTAHELKKVKDLPAVLADKKSELQTFLKKQPGNADDDATLTAVVAYYNSLQ